MFGRVERERSCLIIEEVIGGTTVYVNWAVPTA
jgi:hypothetical protein